jgi:tetratricopeptide (TPR) repeat protein
MPADWRVQRGTQRHLHGAGLALFGQRSIGLVGREAERDQLWKALVETRAERAPRLIVIEGPTGSGKSALAGWIAERAEEVGAAQVLKATHSPEEGPSDGLSGMLYRHLRFFELSREDMVARAEKELQRLGEPDPDEALALAELAVPSSEEELQATGLGARFSGPRERHALLSRYLCRLAAHRPVILWLDDLPFGSDSQRFVADLLLNELEAPILVLATARAEALAEEPARARAIQALSELPCSERLELGELEREAQAALVRELLGLDPELAAQVESRSRGNPLFAVQLVGDWVARDLLVPGKNGFRLASGAKAGFPEGLLGVWEARIDQLFEGCGEDESLGIELAAVGGQTVEAKEWTTACEAAGFSVPSELLGELLRLRLAVPTPSTDGWAFVHGMLREALVQRASKSGRLQHWSSLWADVLGDRPDKVPRRARHLLVAGRVAEAPEPLAEAVIAELKKGEFARVGELLELRRAAVDELDLVEIHPLRLTGDILESRLLRRTGKNKESYERAAWVLSRARECGDLRTEVAALAASGNSAVSVGRIEEAEQQLGEALRKARKQGWARETAALSSNLAFVLMRQGRHAEAAKVFRETAFAAEGAGDSLRVADCYSMLARCHFQSGEVVKAAFLLEEARFRFQRLGARWGLATIANTRGELARSTGKLQEAEVAYQEAAVRFDSCGSGDGVFSRLNVGLTLAERGKPGRALNIFKSVEGELRDSGRVSVVAALHTIRLFPLAALGRWRRLAEELTKAENTIAKAGMVDIDLGRFAVEAAKLCDKAGRTELSRRVWTIARDQWRALGREALESEAQSHL